MNDLPQSNSQPDVPEAQVAAAEDGPEPRVERRALVIGGGIAGIQAALDLADRAYVMESGEVVLEGTASELAADQRVQRAYLGRASS